MCLECPITEPRRRCSKGGLAVLALHDFDFYGCSIIEIRKKRIALPFVAASEREGQGTHFLGVPSKMASYNGKGQATRPQGWRFGYDNPDRVNPATTAAPPPDQC